MRIFLLAFVLAQGSARAVISGNFRFTDNGSSVTIDDYVGFPSGHLEIPASIDGKPVTKLGEMGFQYLQNVTGVTFPDSLTHLGEHSFFACPKIQSVNLPRNLQFIGSNSFRACQMLTGITIPATNTNFLSENGILFTKDRKKLVIFPSGKTGGYTIPTFVETVGERSFAYNTKLTSITFGEGLKQIEATAFFECSSLQALRMPDSVKAIGASAFRNCVNIATIDLGDGLVSTGDSCFMSCESLETLTLPSSLVQLGNSSFEDCEMLRTVAFVGSLASIAPRTFAHCYKLETITLPTGLESIGDSAFEACRILSSIILPDTITTIGASAFSSCEKLEQIDLPVSLASLGSYAFNRCIALREISIPPTVSVIKPSTFSYCSNLTEIFLPEGITLIESFGFGDCHNLRILAIPSTVTAISNSAFSSCNRLAELYFLGNAPTTMTDSFPQAFFGLTVRYFEGATGFTSPTWRGYPSVNSGSLSPLKHWLVSSSFSVNENIIERTGETPTGLLLAYALNLDPRESSSASEPRSTIENNHLKLAFYSQAPGITYLVQQSPDLSDWSEEGIVISGPDSNGIKSATLKLGGDRRYMRLKVIAP